MLRGSVLAYLVVASAFGPRHCPCPTPPGLSTPGRVTRMGGERRDEQPAEPARCKCEKPEAALAPRGAARSSLNADESVTGGVPAVSTRSPGFAGRAVTVRSIADLRVRTKDELLHVFHRLRC